MQVVKVLVVSALLAIGCAALAGCEQEGPAERAGKAVDQAVDDAGDAVEDAGDKVEDAVE